MNEAPFVRSCGVGCTILGIAGDCCYRKSVTMFCRGYDSLTGMLAASTVALLCAGKNNAKAAVWTLGEPFSFQRPRCFRPFRQPSAPLVGVRPVRKLGPEDKSHKSLSSAVSAGRNVA